MHRLSYAAATAALTAAALMSHAAPARAVGVPPPGFGQPFLVIDGPDASGSILNFFFGSAPSEAEDLTLSGTITQAIGAPSLVGTSFSLFTSEAMDSGAFTLGATVVDEFSLFSGSGFFDPFQAGPGDLNTSVFIGPPFIEPVFGTFEYLADFAEFPDRTALFPEFEVFIAIFLDGPLPTRVFDDPDFGSFSYVEGALPIQRIEISTAGGAPLPPMPPIPLPAAGWMLLGGLAGLARLSALRRRA